MDLKIPIPPNQTNNHGAKPGQPLIRTMQKDIELSSGQTFPPDNLPLPPPLKIMEEIQETGKITKKEGEFNAAGGRQIKNRLKYIFIILAVIIIIGAATGFLYWRNYIYNQPVISHSTCQNFQCVQIKGKGDNQCQTNNDCLLPGPIEPTSLIPTEETEIIEILAGRENLFLEKLEETAFAFKKQGEIKRVLVKLINGEKKYVSFFELVEMTKVKVPSEIIANSKDYTLFVYKPQMEEFKKCQEENIQDIGCSGPRLGLVIQSNDKESLKNQMKEWEKTMVDDLRPLILASATDKILEFQSDTNSAYPAETDIRYKNLPISPIALNYAFFKDLLIIGTSKYSLYQALNALMGQNTIP